MNYDGDNLGADMQYTYAQSAQEGLHEGVKDVVKYLFIGGVALMVAGVVFKGKKIKTVLKELV